MKKKPAIFLYRHPSVPDDDATIKKHYTGSHFCVVARDRNQDWTVFGPNGATREEAADKWNRGVLGVIK